MTSLVQPARVLIDPLDGTQVAVEAHRWVWPVLILALCVSASGTLYSLRWDAAPDVIRQLEASGGMTGLSEADLTDQIQTATRKSLVGAIAKGVFLMPLLTLLLACALWVVAWLFDRPTPFGRLMSAAAVSLLPTALYHAVYAVCAAAQHTLTAERAQRLVPSNLGVVLEGLSPTLMRVATAVDFFNLWGAVLLGLGFAAATGMSRGRAVALGLVMYAMYAGVVVVGLPGMGGGR
jgi:hypothetical protein